MPEGLADRTRASAILSGSDAAAQRAVLACARLVSDPLPLPEVGHLLESRDSSLAAAAEAYLTAEDSSAARRLVLSRHPGDAIILGARQQYDPGHHTYGIFDQLEDQLRDEAREGVEVYALLSAGYWGDAGQIVLRIDKGSAELMYAADPARYRLRDISPEELAKLREFIASSRIEDHGPLAIAAHDGMQYEYVHIAKDGGRRVFMNNPGMGGSGGSAYDLVCDYFRRLVASGSMELKYRLARQVPGFEVLLADSSVPVLNVWKSGADLRLLVQRGPVGRSGGVSIANASGAQITITRPEDPAPPGWVSFTGGRIGGEAQAPPAFSRPNLRDGFPPKMEIKDHLHVSPWSLTAGRSSYRVGAWNGKEGLWRSVPGRDPALVVSGNCAFPVVTPDGEWALVAKTDTNWAEPNYVLRIHLTTGKAFRLDLPPADTFNPVAYISAHRKFLVMRAKDAETGSSRKPVGPDQPEYYLVDPATGAAQMVSGEFGPLSDQDARPLQAAGSPDERWAALFDVKTGGTEVGRYDAKTFAFRPALSLPGIRFSSAEMWVDEPEGKIYIAYRGHLLRLPLPPQ